jgi:hypothetical protein
MKSVRTLVKELETMIGRHELDQSKLAMKVKEIEETLELAESALNLVPSVMSCGSVQNNDKLVVNMCKSYRHDFGLMSEKQQDHLKFQCKEWLRAFENNVSHCS